MSHSGRGGVSRASVRNDSSRGKRTYRGSSDVNGSGRQLRVESLESRRMLAVFTVTNINDAPVAAAGEAPGTLRQALFDANATAVADTIAFQGGLTGTITLTAGELSVVQPVNIVGPGADQLTIDASGNDSSPGLSDGSGTRVLNVDNGDIDDVISVELSGLTLTGGDVSGDGGGIRSRENLSISESTISGNSAVGSSAKGGGIANYGGELNIDASAISNNSAIGSLADGGGIHLATRVFGQQPTSITNSTISNNMATHSGGGVFSSNNLLEDQATEIVNSTISGNSAGASGGGLFNFDGATVIRHSTVTDNTAGVDQGSGVSTYGDTGTSTQLHSSIVSGNTGGDLAVVSGNVNSFVSDEYNLIGVGNSFGPGNTYSALDNFNAAGDQTGIINPGLGSLAENGGPTLTHAVLPASPALDAGDPNAMANIGGVPEFDQRGLPFGRVQDGNNDSTARIDIGAFETALDSNSADFDSDGDIDGADFLAWQRGYEILAGAAKSDGDADNDGAVNEDDLDIWEEMFGTTPPLPITHGGSFNGLMMLGDSDAMAATVNRLGTAAATHHPDGEESSDLPSFYVPFAALGTPLVNGGESNVAAVEEGTGEAVGTVSTHLDNESADDDGIRADVADLVFAEL